MGDDALREDRLQALERIAADDDGRHPSRRWQDAGTQDEQDDAEAELQDLVGVGLLAARTDGALSGDRWCISSAGRSALRERETLRSNVRSRNTACRLAIIEWLYAVKHGDSRLDEGDWDRFGEVEGNVWVGRPFPESALEKASRSLYDEGLITGISSFGHERIERPEITSKGEAWLDGQDTSPGATSGSGASFTFHGPATVTSVDRSPYATVTQNVTFSEDDRRVLLQRLEAVDQALILAPLDDAAAQAEALDAARAVRAEVEAPAPDRGRVAAAVKRLADGIASGFGTAAGSALVTGTVAGLGQVLSSS